MSKWKLDTFIIKVFFKAHFIPQCCVCCRTLILKDIIRPLLKLTNYTIAIQSDMNLLHWYLNSLLLIAFSLDLVWRCISLHSIMYNHTSTMIHSKPAHVCFGLVPLRGGDWHLESHLMYCRLHILHLSNLLLHTTMTNTRSFNVSVDMLQRLTCG